MKVKCGGPGPRALDGDLLEIVFDQLADPRGAVDVGNDLEQEVWRGERRPRRRRVQRLVLVAHRSRCDPHLAVVERTDKRVDLDVERRIGELLGEAPELAAAVDRRPVVEEHGVGIAPLATAERDRDDLAGLGVVAEAGRVRHADELVFDDAAVGHQWLRHQRAQLIRIGAIGNDEILAIDEAIGSRRKGRTCQRHRKGSLTHVAFSHGSSS